MTLSATEKALEIGSFEWVNRFMAIYPGYRCSFDRGENEASVHNNALGIMFVVRPRQDPADMYVDISAAAAEAVSKRAFRLESEARLLRKYQQDLEGEERLHGDGKDWHPVVWLISCMIEAFVRKELEGHEANEHNVAFGPDYDVNGWVDVYDNCLEGLDTAVRAMAVPRLGVNVS